MNKLMLLNWIVVVLMAACQPLAAMPVQVQPQNANVVSNVANGVYTDPNGHFTVPLPTNWRAVDEEGYTALYSPEDRLAVYLLTFDPVGPGEAGAIEEAGAIDEAVSQAWTMVDPTFNLLPSSVNEAPSRSGVRRTLYYDYVTPAEEVVMASAEETDKRLYVILLRGEARAFGERSTQISIILGGLTLLGVEQVDLSGVAAHQLTPQMLDELRAYIADAIVRFDVPGAAVAIVQGDEIVMLEGFGVAEAGQAAPVTPQTRMMIGSIGKTMTTMLMARYADQGLMDWDTPVQAILPQFEVADPAISRQMTMRHLVCACTGVPRRDLEFVFNAGEISAEKIIDSLRTFEFYTAFGEAFQYSNQLVASAGWIAAVAAGAVVGELDRAYVDQIEHELFGPLGMAATTFSFDEVVASGDYATPHRLSLAGGRVPLPVESEEILLRVAPAGSVWSTSEDMAAYLLTQMHQGVAPDGTRIVSSQNLGETWQPQVAVGATASYGLGWFVDSYNGQPMLHHGGNTSGFTSDLAFLREADLGIVILTNGRLANAFTLAIRFRLFEMAFAQAYETDEVAAFEDNQILQSALAPLVGATSVDVAAVTPFLGRYRNDALGEVELRLDGDTLTLVSDDLAMEVLAVPGETDETGESGKTGYVIASYIGPLLGVGVQLSMDDEGTPALTLTKDVDQYHFIAIR